LGEAADAVAGDQKYDHHNVMGFWRNDFGSHLLLSDDDDDDCRYQHDDCRL